MDLTPPVISGVNMSLITSAGATFTWTTNETSDSEVEYGPTTAYGAFSTLDVNRVTAHTMVVTGLAPSALYHFRVRSRDAAGNLAVSGDSTFTTLEGTLPSVVITAPAAGAIVSGTIMVTANATDNVADLAGYKLYYGTASGTYSVNVDVGPVTTYTVGGLQPGTLYYFAVTACNTGGYESGISNEVSAVR